MPKVCATEMTAPVVQLGRWLYYRFKRRAYINSNIRVRRTQSLFGFWPPSHWIGTSGMLARVTPEHATDPLPRRKEPAGMGVCSGRASCVWFP